MQPETATSSSSGDRRARQRRNPALLGLLVAVVLFQLAVIAHNALLLSAPRGPILLQPSASGEVRAQPLSSEVVPAFASRESLRVLEVNGVPAAPGRAAFERLVAAVDERPGALNRYRLIGERSGEVRVIRARASRPEGRVVLRRVRFGLTYHLLGWLYLALGIFAWWRRPEEPAARALLLFCCVPPTAMAMVLNGTAIGYWLRSINWGALPLYGAAGAWLAAQFTGLVHRRALQRWLRVVMTLSFVASAATLVLAVVGWDTALRVGGALSVLTSATGVLLIGTVATMGVCCWIASRPGNPPALRARARLLGAAVLISYAVPSLRLVFSPRVNQDYSADIALLIDVLMMAAFPIAIAYAIVRQGLFDMRLFVRRGLVYGALSVSLLLAYAAAVGFVVKALGHGDGVTAWMGALAVVAVLAISAAQIRIQGSINRFVFRGRYVYAPAVARASETLVRARNLDAIGHTVRSALLEAMGLARATVALWAPGREGEMLLCTTVGNEPDPETGQPPPELPTELDVSALEPVQRALSNSGLVSRHDRAAIEAEHEWGYEHDVAPPSSSEAGFWAHYGLEQIVPLPAGAARGKSAVVGFLLVGPRLDGRAIGDEGSALLSTVANQLAVAVDNALAFEEIERLKDGLEDTVEERTRELETALSELREAQLQLVETEKAAVLGRITAGIVHEINSPLGALRSSSSTVATALERCRSYVAPRADADEDAARALKAVEAGGKLTSNIEQSSARISEIVRSLQRFVSLDEAELQVVDVREGIRSAVTLLGPEARERIEVELDLPSEPARVRCMPHKLNQVFLSLLQNSVNAIRDTGRIEVELKRDDDVFLLEVRDDGCGIEPARLDGIFDPKFAEKQGRIGMALGLPTSRRTVVGLGGSIEIRSDVGRGTVVAITLPVAEAERERSAAAGASEYARAQ